MSLRSPIPNDRNPFVRKFKFWILKLVCYLVLGIWCLLWIWIKVSKYFAKILETCLIPPGSELCCFGDQSWAKASGTDLYSNRPSLFDRLHLMKVRIPDFSGLVVGMTHIVAKNRPFPTDLTHFCHSGTSKWILHRLTWPEQICKKDYYTYHSSPLERKEAFGLQEYISRKGE